MPGRKASANRLWPPWRCGRVHHHQRYIAPAPGFCSQCMKFTWVCTGLPPHTTISSDSITSRGSSPRLAPTPASQPASDKATQKVSRWRDQPARWPSRRMAGALHHAHGAGVVIGPDALRAVAGGGADDALGQQIQRGIPADRVNWPLPLVAHPQQGWFSLLGWCTRSA